MTKESIHTITTKDIERAIQSLRSTSIEQSEIGMFMIDKDKVVKVDSNSTQKMKKKAIKLITANQIIASDKNL